MFANQRRGTAGLGSIAAVAVIAFAWLFGAGLMVKTYGEGTAIAGLSSAANCALVCERSSPNSNLYGPVVRE